MSGQKDHYNDKAMNERDGLQRKWYFKFYITSARHNLSGNSIFEY